MASIHKTITAHCPNCTQDTEFDFVLRYVDYKGIVPCFRCTACNNVCPEHAFSGYLETGQIAISM